MLMESFALIAETIRSVSSKSVFVESKETCKLGNDATDTVGLVTKEAQSSRPRRTVSLHPEVKTRTKQWLAGGQDSERAYAGPSCCVRSMCELAATCDDLVQARCRGAAAC